MIAKQDNFDQAACQNEEVESSRKELHNCARRFADEEERVRVESTTNKAIEQEEIGSLRHQLTSSKSRSSEGGTLGKLRAEHEPYKEASQLIVALLAY